MYEIELEAFASVPNMVIGNTCGTVSPLIILLVRGDIACREESHLKCMDNNFYFFVKNTWSHGAIQCPEHINKCGIC